MNNLKVEIQIDYADVCGKIPPKSNRRLISVEKIVTAQPFDMEIYQQFNPESESS